MIEFKFPDLARDRGPGFWLRPRNIAASQRTLRLDYSNEWRYTFGEPNPPDRVVSAARLLGDRPQGYRIVVLGDTGEGDRSQYGLVPLIRALRPQMMIINGDVAYPAGRAGTFDPNDDDFLIGFFRPYRNLGIPIWATAGNHEYYSPANGRDFHEVFCTRKFDDAWSDHGLPHAVLQPGMYWELRDDAAKLVIIGLDSGKAANLDGDNSWWQVWKRKIHPDGRQHAWLDERLRRADANGDRAIVLFHIPALVDQAHKEDDLSVLHRILAAHPSVSAILCGHEHNYQSYSQGTFRRYLEERHTKYITPRSNAHYIVAGSSGAALASTEFKERAYQAVAYPSAQDWRTVAGLGRVATKPLQKTVIGAIVGRLSQNAAADGDAAMYLSLVVIDIGPRGAARTAVTITPGLMESLDKLFEGIPPRTVVDLMDANAPINRAEVARCLQRLPHIQL